MESNDYETLLSLNVKLCARSGNTEHAHSLLYNLTVQLQTPVLGSESINVSRSYGSMFSRKVVVHFLFKKWQWHFSNKFGFVWSWITFDFNSSTSCQAWKQPACSKDVVLSVRVALYIYTGIGERKHFHGPMTPFLQKRDHQVFKTIRFHFVKKWYHVIMHHFCQQKFSFVPGLETAGILTACCTVFCTVPYIITGLEERKHCHDHMTLLYFKNGGAIY